MNFPTEFTYSPEFIGFKRRIGDPCALEYLFRLSALCYSKKGESIYLPVDLVRECLGVAPATAPDLVWQALLDFRFIRLVPSDEDRFDILVFHENNAGIIQSWKNGRKGGRPRYDEGETPARPASQFSITH